MSIIIIHIIIKQLFTELGGPASPSLSACSACLAGPYHKSNIHDTYTYLCLSLSLYIYIYMYTHVHYLE